METKFNDEQIASEKSFTQMAKDYSNLHQTFSKVYTQQEKTQSQTNVNDELFLAAVAMENLNELFLQMEKRIINKNLKNYYQQLKSINKNELNDMIDKFSITKFLTKNNKKNLIYNNNFMKIKNDIVKNEMIVISNIVNALQNNNINENKNWLNDIVMRRLELVENLMS